MPPPSARNNLVSVISTFFFVVLDITICFLCLCAHESPFSVSNFTKQFSQPYSFLRSTVDFFALSLLRFVYLVSGCLLLFIHNDPLYWLQWGKHVSFSLCILFCSFSPTKLLGRFPSNTFLVSFSRSIWEQKPAFCWRLDCRFREHPLLGRRTLVVEQFYPQSTGKERQGRRFILPSTSG